MLQIVLTLLLVVDSAVSDVEVVVVFGVEYNGSPSPGS